MKIPVALQRNAINVITPIVGVLAAFVLVAVFLLLLGRNPVNVYGEMFSSAFGDAFSVSETLVVATPVIFCGLGVAVAAWFGLLSVGAEGQLYVGAIGSTCVALSFPEIPGWGLLPLMLICGAFLGAIWSGIPGLLKATLDVNETIVTLLLNYVAILVLEYSLHGPLQDSESFSWPQTAAFSSNAELPRFGVGRLHWGFAIAVVAAFVCWLILTKTRIGFIVRVVSNNKNAAFYAHYPVMKYIVIAMLVSGGLAAVAGFCQVSAIEGRLRSGISPGYGYTGFLVAWLARNHPIGIIFFSIFLAGILSGGDSLQLKEGLPFATVNILQGTILLCLLSAEYFSNRLKNRLGSGGLIDG